MMVIYLPVKFEFDWTNRVRKQKCGRTDIGHIILIGGLVTCNPPKKLSLVTFFYTWEFKVTLK